MITSFILNIQNPFYSKLLHKPKTQNPKPKTQKPKKQNPIFQRVTIPSPYLQNHLTKTPPSVSQRSTLYLIYRSIIYDLQYSTIYNLSLLSFAHYAKMPRNLVPPLGSGYISTLTLQQKMSLERFKSEVVVEEEVESHPEGDKYLLRILRATMKDKSGKRIFQVEKAKPRLYKVLRWKRAINLEEGGIPPPKFEIYRANYQLWVWRDYSCNALIAFSRLGKFANSVDVKAMTHEEWMQCVGYENQLLEEEVCSFSEDIGAEIPGVLSVSDVSGAGMGAANPSRMSLLRNMSSWSANHFPELNRKIVIVNTPKLFPMLMKVAKAGLDPVTAAKIDVYSKVPKELFCDTFDKCMLPKELGGERVLHDKDTLRVSTRTKGCGPQQQSLNRAGAVSA